MDLIFKQISVENFRSFIGKHILELARQPGLYSVTGKNLVQTDLGSNDAGKSSLFIDAIFWCLIGKTARSARPGSAIEPWATTKETTAVILDLTINNQDYQIRRTRKPNSLTLNGETVEQDRISKLIPISDDVLRYTILVGQFENLFLDLKPDQQSALFTELLNLTLWIDAADLAGKKARQKKQEQQTIGQAVAKIEGQLLEIMDGLTQTELGAAAFEQDKTKAQAKLAEQARVLTGAMAEHDKIDCKPPVGDEDAGNEPQGVRAQERSVQRSTDRQRGLKLKQQKALQNVARLENIIQQSHSQIAAYDQTVDRCPECGQVVTQEHLVEKRHELSVTIATANNDLAGWQSMVLEYDKLTIRYEQDLVALQEQIKASQKRRELEHNLAAVLSELEQLDSKENGFVKQMERLATRQQKLELELSLAQTKLTNLETETGMLSYWSDAFKEIRLKLIDDTLIELEFAVNRHAEALGLIGWAMRFQTERTTLSGNINHKFSVFIHPPGQADPVGWENLAGGVSQRWNLAACFALSEVLLGRFGLTPNLLVLDEPLKHLSQTGIDDLLEHLRNHAIELSRSIYIVEHQLLSEGCFDGVITIEKQEAGSIIVEK